MFLAFSDSWAFWVLWAFRTFGTLIFSWFGHFPNCANYRICRDNLGEINPNFCHATPDLVEVGRTHRCVANSDRTPLKVVRRTGSVPCKLARRARAQQYWTSSNADVVTPIMLSLSPKLAQGNAIRVQCRHVQSQWRPLYCEVQCDT